MAMDKIHHDFWALGTCAITNYPNVPSSTKEQAAGAMLYINLYVNGSTSPIPFKTCIS